MPMTTDAEFADRVKQLTVLLNKAANNCRDRGLAVSFDVDLLENCMTVNSQVHKKL